MFKLNTHSLFSGSRSRGVNEPHVAPEPRVAHPCSRWTKWLLNITVVLMQQQNAADIIKSDPANCYMPTQGHWLAVHSEHFQSGTFLKENNGCMYCPQWEGNPCKQSCFHSSAQNDAAVSLMLCLAGCLFSSGCWNNQDFKGIFARIFPQCSLE